VKERDVLKMSWNCVVVARRIRCGIQEALVQWECCWVDEDDGVGEHKVLEVLLRRTVREQRQMLVHWACQWIPIEDCDPGALEDFQGEEVVDDLALPVSQQIVQAKKKKRARRRNW
jgi:hypothetical protein